MMHVGVNIITLCDEIPLLKILRVACAMSLFLLLSAVWAITPSFAHTTISVGKYDVEAGWEIEPPIVGLRNSVFMSVSERGDVEGKSTGVTHAFRNIEATILFGGKSKVISFNPANFPGYYLSPIIPTKTGTYLVQVVGDIRGTPVDITIPIEDVEHTAALDFPPVLGGGNSGNGNGGGIDTAESVAMQKAIISLQQDIARLKSGETTASSSTNDGLSYNFAVMGLSMSVAAIVLGVIALTRKQAA